jgi:hypothetical protein
MQTLRLGPVSTEVVMKRHRSVSQAFEDRIIAERARLEAQLVNVPHGPARDELLRKIRQLDTAAHISEWLSSPGLQPPKPA